MISGKVLALVILSRDKIEEEEKSAPHMEGKKKKNLSGFVLIYRKLETIVTLHKTIYKHVQSQVIIGRQLEKQNSLTSQQLWNLITFLVQKFCSIFKCSFCKTITPLPKASLGSKDGQRNDLKFRL